MLIQIILALTITTSSQIQSWDGFSITKNCGLSAIPFHIEDTTYSYHTATQFADLSQLAADTIFLILPTEYKSVTTKSRHWLNFYFDIDTTVFLVLGEDGKFHKAIRQPSFVYSPTEYEIITRYHSAYRLDTKDKLHPRLIRSWVKD